MAKPWQPPTGRIRAHHGVFNEIVRDLRYCVFSIMRLRPDGSGQKGRVNLIGSGSAFFVGPHTLMTCHHVVNPGDNPHQDGDAVALVQNLGGGQVRTTAPVTLREGTDLHFFPDCDLAIIQTGGNEFPYATIGYQDILEGTEIGIAGYPLAQVTLGPNNEPQFPNVIYRVAKGVVTSVADRSLNAPPNPQTKILRTVEVNFMFVPGNSGGPIFDAENGRVIAFVAGFASPEIKQDYQNTRPEHIAAGAPDKHVQSLHAIYSIGIKLEGVRTELERFGVVLP